MALGTDTIDGDSISLQLAHKVGDGSGLRTDTFEVILNPS